MTDKRIPNLFIENAEVLPGSFRNFAGRGDKYNKEGDRNFNIVISDPVFANELLRDGWNLREMRRRDDDDPNEPPRYKLNIAVSFRQLRGLPPMKVYLYSGGKRTELDEETIATLDYAEYRTADLTVRPRIWTDDKTGEKRVKAYLQEMHVVIQADKWAEKYKNYGMEDGEDEDMPF